MEKLQDSMFPNLMKRGCLAAILIFLLCALEAKAQTTSFVFQSTLPQEITPATAAYEMEFKLFDSATGGTQIGGTRTVADVAVKNRVFSVQLDYGAAAFPGADRFVETSVRVSNSEPFTAITTRQQILSAPYSIRARNAATADSASQLGGVDASSFVLTTDARLSDSRDPDPGSSNYIQNSFLPQAGAHFNITGNGTVGGTFSENIVNAATHYTINGRRVLLSRPGVFNTFVGEDAGNNGVTGGANSFFGLGAGQNIAAGLRIHFSEQVPA